MGKVRLYIDSVWDSDVVVLISTDYRTEKAIKFEKDALAQLLEGRRGFFESGKLKRRIEGKVAVFPPTDNNFFTTLVEEFQRLPRTVDESLVLKVSVKDLQRLR